MEMLTALIWMFHGIPYVELSSQYLFYFLIDSEKKNCVVLKCVCVCVHMCIHVCVCVRTRVYMCVCMHTRMCT